MRPFVQWICWKYEDRGGKRAKLPLNPRDGSLASVSDPATWATFDNACTAASDYDGIGFVFTADDPFAGIDIDPTTDPAIRARQDAIYAAFNSYTERSPSGQGVHIIVRGTVPTGRRRDCVELYPSGRFFTMTGDVVNDAPIVGRQELLSQLWHEMAPPSASPAGDASTFYREATEADDTIYERAAKAANGDKFVRLWNGDGSALPGSDKSGSAIDQALVNFLAFYTKSPDQIERLWLRSPQGQRDKTRNRADYRASTIRRAFDNEQPVGNFNGTTANGAHWVPGVGVVPATPAEQRYKPLSAADLRALSPLRWIIKGVLPAHGLAVMYGPSASGKSFLAIDMGCAVADAPSWFGYRTKPANVVYLALEGQAGIRNRVLAWETRNRRELPDGFRVILETFKLTNPDDVRALAEVCPKGGVVIVDTFARAGDDDPNDAKLRAANVAGALSLQSMIGGVVVLVAHTGKDETRGISGMKSLFDAADAVIFVSRKDTGRTWKADKVKDGNDEKEHAFTLNTVFLGVDDDGDPITSCTVELVAEVSYGPAHRIAAETAADELFMRLLAEFTAQGRTVSAHPASRTHAALMFAQTAAGKSFKRSGFEAAMQRLFETKRIRVEHVGPASKRKEIVVAACAEMPSDPPSDPFPTASDPYAAPHADPGADPFRPPAFSPPKPP